MRKCLLSCLVLFLLAVSMGSAFGGNLLINGNFNSPDNNAMDNSGWNAWWAGERLCGRETWADRAYNGRGFAAYGWGAASFVGIYQDVAATPGVTYSFTVWIKKESNFNENYTEIKLEWKDSNFSDLGGTVGLNLTGQAGTSYARYTVSGSSTNPACAYVRPVIYTQWGVPATNNSATIHFDDAELVAEPGSMILISGLPLVMAGMCFVVPVLKRRMKRESVGQGKQ